MQIEIPFHQLYRNEKLQTSLWPDISNRILEQLQDTKYLIEKWKEDCYIVALVHLSGDLMHSSHLQYMNTIKAKVSREYWVPESMIKLVVGVEADTRTKERKNKENVNKEDERVYMFKNLKAVDHAFIEFESLDEQVNERRPAGIVKYLQPSVMASHQEHIGDAAEIVKEKAKDNWFDITVINYWDTEKYLWEPENRNRYNRSTTNTIKQILSLYKDHPKYQ